MPSPGLGQQTSMGHACLAELESYAVCPCVEYGLYAMGSVGSEGILSGSF